MLDWIQRQFQQWQFRKAKKEFQQCVAGESMETSPEILFRLMDLFFQLNPDSRKNIRGFSGTYQFKSEDNKVAVLATFDDERITVEETLYAEPDITIIFKDSRSIINSFISPKKDILKTLHDNKVALQGNLNYVYKLGFLTDHIQLALNGNLPQ
ncbi:MAG: SCP2 sterol-binding domain-containing protein [bacterium]